MVIFWSSNFPILHSVPEAFFLLSLNGGKGGACLRRFESGRVDVHKFRKNVHVHCELP